MYSRKMMAALVVLLLALGVACSTNRANPRSQKDAVEKALAQAGMKDINVDVDQDKKVVTLKGDVPSEDLKNQAADMAQQASPGWVVANELAVRPVGAEGEAKKIEGNLDDGIENNFKAALVANHLDDAGIKFDAKNGVLTLEGKVKSADIRTQAEKLGASVPNVQQVVNKIEVKGAKEHRGGE